MARRPRLICSSLALAALLPVHAAELGDPRVVSHIGQPLVADVELTMLEDAATPVRVRVASAEVYNGAGIAVPPVLSSLNLSVMRRDGRQFLHVTSRRPVDADHVHLYLELVDKGQRGVRLATLWLTPDPTPAPVAAPVPAAAPSQDAVLLAQVERARAAAPAPEAPPRPVRVVKAPRPHPAPVAKAAPVPHPAACAIPAGEAQACAALGAKNDELRTRLGQVEDRMKKLQVSLAAPVPAAPPAKVDVPKPAAAEQPKPVVPAGPRPIHSIKPLVPHKPKTAAPPDAGWPWGWIGAVTGVLALAGAGAFVVVRRRTAGGAAAPGLLDRLKARFAARTRAPRDEGAEPTID
jgi:hypothetical protein